MPSNDGHQPSTSSGFGNPELGCDITRGSASLCPNAVLKPIYIVFIDEYIQIIDLTDLWVSLFNVLSSKKFQILLLNINRIRDGRNSRKSKIKSARHRLCALDGW